MNRQCLTTTIENKKKKEIRDISLEQINNVDPGK